MGREPSGSQPNYQLTGTKDMNEQQLNTNDLETNGLPEGMDELTILKQRAKSLGINHSNNIGVDALREKIRQKLEGESVEDDEDEAESVAAEVPSAAAVDPHPSVAAQVIANKVNQTPMSARQQLIKDATRLIRCRIVNLDPKKKEWPGEFFTVANEYIGTHKKYVPYGEAGQSYHVPKVIFDLLKEKTYLHIRTYKDPANPQKQKVEERYMPEFSIEELPPLTQAELEELRKAQNASGRVDLKD